MDKTAETHEYVGKVDKHASQKDYASGFGGKFGVQSDRQDRSAVGWDHVEKVDKHESQKGEFQLKGATKNSSVGLLSFNLSVNTVTYRYD